MAQTLTIPAAPLVAGVPLPPVCPRHGSPAVGTRRMTFSTRTPVWVVLLFVVGLGVAILVALLLTKRVKAAAVPVCSRCVAEHRVRMQVVVGALVAVPVLVALGSVAGESGLAPLALLTGLLVAPLVALVVGLQGQWPALVRGVVERDGQWVTLRNPAPAFAAAYAVLAGSV